MNLPQPAFLVLAPFALGVILLLPRRWPALTGVVGAAAAAWLLGRVSALAGTETETGVLAVWQVLGRDLVLSEDVRLALLLVYGALVLFFALSVVWPQGTAFVPVALLMMSPLTAGLMVNPFTYGLLALVAAACLGGVLVQTNRAGSAQGALRYVMLTALTIPLFLLAGWIFESGTNTFSLTAGRLLLVGTIVLLAGFPFHIWVPALLREAPPLVIAFLLGAVQLLVLLFCLRLLGSTSAVLAGEEVTLWLRGSGVATVLVAGLLATQAPTFSRLLGYLLLVDVGLLLVGIAQSDGDAAVVMGLLLARTASLTLAGLGLSSLRRRRDGEILAHSQGLARQLPGSAALFYFGALSLLGLPLTPGYGPHWTILRESALTASWLPPLLLLGIGLALAGLLRAGRLALAPAADAAGMPAALRRDWRQWLLGGILMIGVLLSLFSPSWMAYTTELAGWIRPIVFGI